MCDKKPYNAHSMKTHPPVLAALLLVASASADVISYLRFEEGSGFGAFDETGLLHGEVLGFTSVDPGRGDMGGSGWSTSVPSSTVPLTGASNTGSLHFGPGYVDLSNGNALNLGAEFTIEFYMNPDQPIGGSAAFGLEPNDRLFVSLIDDGGELRWWTQFQDEFSLAPADQVQVGEWQHVAFVVEPAEYTIYIDGQIQHNGPIPAGGEGPYFFPGTGLTGDRTIGGESSTFSGWIDEFRISDEALTPDQFLGAFVIPEPSTCVLVALAGLGLVLRQRSRKRSLYGWG